MDELDRVVTELDSRRPARLGALSRADSLDLIASRPPSWRVRGILSSDDYGVLAGPKGVGKTFALADLAVSVALGRPWFGRFDTERAAVAMFTSEDSRARLWRRADAIARAAGSDPADLEGWLFIHPLSFSAVDDLPRLEAELEALEPGLALLDPAFRYMNGVRAQLFDMGAVLTPLQEACQAAGAPLIVGHHYNRRDGANREERISGAGLLEWARLVITATAPRRRDEDPDVVVTFEVTGNSIDPLTFRVRRRVEALDDSPNPELRYSAEVIAEGVQARAAEYQTAADRVRAVLGIGESEARTIREIGDAVAHDGTGKGGLKHDTIRRALNRDLADEVDSSSIGDGRETLWWTRDK
jgi:AAA domain